MYSLLLIILIIQVNTFYVNPLEKGNYEFANEHIVEIKSGPKIQSIGHVLSRIILEKDYELEVKKQLLDILERKSGKSKNIFTTPKRKSENTETTKIKYYTRPCLLNAISCLHL